MKVREVKTEEKVEQVTKLNGELIDSGAQAVNGELISYKETTSMGTSAIENDIKYSHETKATEEMEAQERSETSKYKGQKIAMNNGELCYRTSLYSRLYKVIVIGEIGTGKSALIRRYVHKYFNDQFGLNRSTIGVDFSLKLLTYPKDLEIRLQLWDIAGQERFSSMTRVYYRGTMGALLIFDHSNANSFQAIHR